MGGRRAKVVNACVHLVEERGSRIVREFFAGWGAE